MRLDNAGGSIEDTDQGYHIVVHEGHIAYYSYWPGPGRKQVNLTLRGPGEYDVPRGYRDTDATTEGAKDAS